MEVWAVVLVAVGALAVLLGSGRFPGSVAIFVLGVTFVWYGVAEYESGLINLVTLAAFIRLGMSEGQWRKALVTGDYEVFLLSRIKEEFDRTRDNARAVAGGLARTARLITAAAAIMICVFGGFVVSDERALQLFGFGLAIAILVDVTVVRLLLVPSTMELLGNANWWLPRWLDRVLPRLTFAERFEPAVAPAATTGDGARARTPTLGAPVGMTDRGREG